VPVRGQLDCLFDGSAPIALRTVMRDLREERAAEAERDHLQAQFQAALDSPAIGMAVQALDGRWQEVNAAFAEMLGYQAAELIDMTFRDVTHPDDIEPNVELLQTLLTGAERCSQIEKRYIHRDGSIVSAILTVSLVIDRDGKPLCFVSQIQDVTARRRLETQLLHKASHDVLTGLPNRSLFMDRLEHALARLQREDSRIAVMFLDLDGFKSVNDQYGHDQGDRLLVEVGRRLRACARAGDTVARLGGDEFTILLENVRHPSIASEVAQRVRETLRYPVMLGEHVTTISPSIGICLSLGSGDNAEAMLHAADTAMYAAKRAGKDRAVVATR
jgi:diguanylate cyclase (GGDEF)-like protein/PAS domain S-box-containing protein